MAICGAPSGIEPTAATSSPRIRADEVLARGIGWHDVLELPAEQGAVEIRGRLGIGLARVDPARDSGDVSVSLRHWCSFCRLRSRGDPTTDLGQVLSAMSREHGIAMTRDLRAAARASRRCSRRAANGAAASWPIASTCRGRTIRRDIERLRALGYPVESLTGPAGGYRLSAGTEMPPLLLDDDEAIAIAVGLGTAARSSVTGIEETAVRALVKLEQVLPAHLRRRVSALGSATVAPAGRRADRRPAAPDRDRRRLPRLRVPAVRLPQPRRRRDPPRGRAARARELRPALVPRRLGPRPRGLAHVPRRPARRPASIGRSLHAAQAAREGRCRVRRAEHRRRRRTATRRA